MAASAGARKIRRAAGGGDGEQAMPKRTTAGSGVSRRQKAPDERPAATVDQLLTFFAAGHEYAISILHVREIAEYRPLTPVPGTPPWIRGVMNLRGTVVPAIDLAAKLGMDATAVTRRTCLLIIEATLEEEPVVLAIMVDSVSRVVDLSADELQDAPSFGPTIDVSFLVGMARIDERLVLLLDLTHIVETSSVLSAAALWTAIDATPNPGEALP